MNKSDFYGKKLFMLKWKIKAGLLISYLIIDVSLLPCL